VSPQLTSGPFAGGQEELIRLALAAVLREFEALLRSGTSDEAMVKVRGVVLFPSTVESVVRAVPDLTNEFLMVLTNNGGLDELTVQAEAEQGVSAERQGQLRRELESAFRTNLGLRANVEVLTYGSLQRTEFKARRIKDQRIKAT
jgi:phenylacetate-CoA ligase